MYEDLTRNREADIYRTAAVLFSKNGFTSTSIRQICRAIGIREGSIYHYIRKKEDLLFGICERSMLVSLDAIKPIAKSNLRADLKLQKMIETHIVTIAQTSDEHSTMLKELRYLSQTAQEKIIKLRDRYETLFRNVVKACIDEGHFRKVDVKISTLALLGMMNWLIHWYSTDGKLTSERIAQMFSDLFVNGPRQSETKYSG